MMKLNLFLLAAALMTSPTIAGAEAKADPAQTIAAAAAWPGTPTDYHGYVCHHLTVDGCDAMVVEPKQAAPGKPWIWRAMFWDAFPSVDLALLDKGFHLAYIEVGNTFGAPDAMAHWTRSTSCSPGRTACPNTRRLRA